MATSTDLAEYLDSLAKQQQEYQNQINNYSKSVQDQLNDTKTFSADMQASFDSELQKQLDAQLQAAAQTDIQTRQLLAARQQQQQEAQAAANQQSWAAQAEATAAAADQTRQNFALNSAPQLQSQAIAAGAFGSSRSGVAEGLARGRMEQQLAEQAMGGFGSLAQNEQRIQQGTAKTYSDIGGKLAQQGLEQTAQSGLATQQQGLSGAEQSAGFANQIGQDVIKAGIAQDLMKAEIGQDAVIGAARS